MSYISALIDDFNQKLRGGAQPSAPLTWHRGRVEIHLGELRLTTELKPLRLAHCSPIIQGYDALLKSYVHTVTPAQALQAFDTFNQSSESSVVRLDRLCRTAHLLNFLPFADEGGFLYLEVNPRHVLSVKNNHGAYFQEVLTQCGLSTARVVIGVAFDHLGNSYQLALSEGLQNYRRRGYKVAIRLNSAHPEKIRQSLALVSRLSPDYVRLDAEFLADHAPHSLPTTQIRHLIALSHSGGGQVIQTGVNTNEQQRIASELNIDLLGGEVWDRLSAAQRRAQRTAQPESTGEQRHEQYA